MNIILFCRDEIGHPLPLHDRRARHILEQLHAVAGSRLHAGILNGERGWMHITAIDGDGIAFEFRAIDSPSPSPHPIMLLVGHPRPPAARRLIRDVTAMGAAHISLFCGKNSERSYMQSSLWQAENIATAMREGLEISGATSEPHIECHGTLDHALRAAGAHYAAAVGRLALVCAGEDEACAVPSVRACLTDRYAQYAVAVGPERGWTPAERRLLASHHYRPVHLGARTLRTETAAIAACGILIDQLLGDTTGGGYKAGAAYRHASD